MPKVTTKTKHTKKTDLIHLGRDPFAYHGVINPPVVHTSTFVFESLQAFKDRGKEEGKFSYGRIGTPQSDSFEKAIASLENGYKAVTYPSGIAAVTASILAFVKAGDHILVADSVYNPTRTFCDTDLQRFGIEVDYYDPAIGADIKNIIRSDTVLIVLESPGSGIFDIQDVPAICSVAQEKHVTTIIDNTWATPLLFNPIDHGVNVVVHAATKYITGHSDVSMGVAVCDSVASYQKVKNQAVTLGFCSGPNDLFLAQRGLRTMAVRLEQSAKSAMVIAEFLQARDEVQRVYYPALADHEGHDIWKRDFKGANGILSFLLKPLHADDVETFIDALDLFPIGFSWGGYESLLQPQELEKIRTVKPWTEKGALLRLQIGLEDVNDLLDDLCQAFDKIKVR